MTNLERVSIAHDVIINNESHLDTARKFRVATTLVVMLIYRLKKNKELLKEVQAKTAAREARTDKIMKTAQGMLDSDKNIIKAA